MKEREKAFEWEKEFFLPDDQTKSILSTNLTVDRACKFRSIANLFILYSTVTIKQIVN